MSEVPLSRVSLSPDSTCMLFLPLSLSNPPPSPVTALGALRVGLQ